jgi:hypothetical protein
MGYLQGQLRHVRYLVVVDAAHGDGVDLDRRERRLEGGHQGAPDLLEVVAAGDKAELLGLEGVQGDVDPVETGLDEPVEVLLEQVAVARHGHLVEAEVLQPADELDDAAPHERLAAGDADLVDAELQAGLGEEEHLFEGEDVALVLELYVLGHAVLAAEVAPVRDGDAQVVHLALVAVR